MHFEARDLKPYAEPIDAESLCEGEVYFTVQFMDAKLLVPIVEPIIYVGKNLNKENAPDLLYFQDFEAYYAGSQEPSDFDVRGPEDIKHIFEYERALDMLMGCALRRRAARRNI